MAAAETLVVLDPPRDAPPAERNIARTAATVMGVGMLASGLLMLVNKDSHLLDLIPGGWDTGALTLGAGRSGVRGRGHGRRDRLQPAQHRLGHDHRPAGHELDDVGCVIGWILAPLLLVQSHLLPDHPSRNVVLQWVMWPGLGMMIAGGMMTIALRWRMLFEAFKGLGGAGNSEDVPLGWIAGGAVVLSIALCVVQSLFFGLPIWMSAVAILLSVPMMLVGLRALGETNWGPIGALSNLTQGLFAGIAPGNLVANVVGAGAAGTIAMTSEGLMQDYRAGYLIGSSPRSMLVAQLMGAPIGAAALAFTYPLLVKTYGLIGDHAQLAAPGARRTAAFAELLSTGVSKLPPFALGPI